MQVGVDRPAETVFDEVGRQLQGVASALDRELLLDARDDEDHRELQSLGLVHRQDGDRVLVGVGFGHRRIVARIAQQVEMGDEGRHAVVFGDFPVGLHRVEELGHVLDAGF